ncbi:MAG: SAM-dependent methyltransferase, partial [Proteobacteria bacterium]|nr:SAM-dependent methyltransferase [Pseudomonadota bacterium]
FAARGHRVLAVDRDPAAIAGLASVAGIEARVADLEADGGWRLPAARFAGIVVTNYLHRPLFAAIAAALTQGGVLIYETFMLGNERYGRPSNPHFLLQPGELSRAFADALSTVAFEQGVVVRPKAAAIQRLCAWRGDAGGAVLERGSVSDQVSADGAGE